MHALTGPRGWRGFVLLALMASLVCTSCKKKATPAECEALVRHFAEVSAKESGVDASAPAISDAIRAAKADPEALACSEEVDGRQLRCALAASSSDAILDCLDR